MILFSVFASNDENKFKKKKKTLRHLKTNSVIRLFLSPTVPKDKETVFFLHSVLYYIYYLEYSV